MTGSEETTAAHRALVEDVEDLKAEVRRLSNLLDAQAGVDSGAGDTFVAGGESSPEAPAAPEEGWQYPPFILLLEGAAFDDELRALIEWVEGVLVPGYLAEPSADARWCHLWFEHTDAIAHLHALWLAWQELTDPATCGYTGPSVWHRDHYRPCIAELRGSGGPFAGCTKGEHQIVHRMPGRVPSAWHQEAASG